MSGWTFRVVWPVEDPEVTYSDLLRLAETDLPLVARRSGALVVGEPRFNLEETGQSWPATELALVCVVDAVPDTDHWPEVIRELAGQGWTDPRIGEHLRCSSERVRGVRRRFGIPSGVARSRLRGAV